MGPTWSTNDKFTTYVDKTLGRPKGYRPLVSLGPGWPKETSLKPFHALDFQVTEFSEIKNYTPYLLNFSNTPCFTLLTEIQGCLGPESSSILIGNLAGLRMLNPLYVGFGHFKIVIKNPFFIKIYPFKDHKS
eukprot:TRINITY_DN10531_c0_g4_i1.p1 TRINITY_DN10531_c0_g4~~TRINITY_DN10531_c0_g4_i1.p1  ORF type:complete len:132 (-),score=1.98 TRINITY_DN10531_c0_g4_i1:910-1305(-)